MPRVQALLRRPVRAPSCAEVAVNIGTAGEGSRSRMHDDAVSLAPARGDAAVSSIEKWCRCRDLNPGPCGYEPHALTS